MVLFFNKGLYGYLISYIFGYAAAAVLLLFVLWKHIKFHLFRFDKSAAGDMVKFSAPLVPNNISWWGVSSANKYIINGYLSGNVLGLYSAALKIPTIINTVQSIFSEALVLSVLEEYNNKEKDEKYFSLIYRFYSFAAVIMTSFIILLTKVISVILFSKEFVSAWVYVPFLCISPVWGSISGYLGTFYSANKKTNGMFFSTLLGTCLTVGISFLTVRRFGVSGIIFSNIAAYFSIWLYRFIDTKRFVKLQINLFKDIVSWLILMLQAAFMVFADNNIIVYAANILLFTALLFMNRTLVATAFSTGKQFLYKLKNKK